MTVYTNTWTIDYCQTQVIEDGTTIKVTIDDETPDTAAVNIDTGYSDLSFEHAAVYDNQITFPFVTNDIQWGTMHLFFYQHSESSLIMTGYLDVFDPDQAGVFGSSSSGGGNQPLIGKGAQRKEGQRGKRETGNTGVVLDDFEGTYGLTLSDPKRMYLGTAIKIELNGNDAVVTYSVPNNTSITYDATFDEDQSALVSSDGAFILFLSKEANYRAICGAQIQDPESNPQLAGVWAAQLNLYSATVSPVAYSFKVAADNEFDGTFYIGLGGMELPLTYTTNEDEFTIEAGKPTLGQLKACPVYIRVSDGSPLWQLESVTVTATVNSETFSYSRGGSNWLGGSNGSIIYLLRTLPDGNS